MNVLASLTEPENRPGLREPRGLVMTITRAHSAHGSSPRGLAAALGSWSGRHRMIAIGLWLLFVVAATVLGSAAGRVGLPDYRQGAGDSARAEQTLASAHIGQPAAEMVLVRSSSAAVTAASPAFRHAVDRTLAEINRTGLVRQVRDPYAGHLLSASGRDALIRFNLADGPDSQVTTVLAAVARAEAASPGFTMTETGDASAQQALTNNIGSNFSRAEWTAVPLAIGVLLGVFGALMAAVLPVLLALTAFIGSIGLADLLSHLVGMNSYANSVMLLMGLAVGVDYSLFYLFRERQERAAGRDRASALQVAAATSGRSVLVSGLIVMTGMVGMLLSGMATFESLGLAAIVVVFVAMLGSVTVLPAMLSLLGDRVELGRIPLPGRRRRRAAQAGGARSGRVWDFMLGRVLARPVLFAAASAALLLGLAAPALGMHTQTLSLGQLLPWNNSQASAMRQITASFPGGPAPAEVVVKAPDIQAPSVRRAIASVETAALRAGALRQPVQLTVYRAANVAEIHAPLPGNGTDAASVAALTTVRQRLIPQAFGHLGGTQALTDGQLAASLDYNAALRTAAIRAFAFVMAAAFVLMLLSLGSVVIAATCVLLDLLSVAAASLVMTAIFVHGWGAALVGTHAVGAIESWIPLFLFVILFGLSMDYHVFVVSRIREARDRGMTTSQAVSHGIRSTAGVVTSAAVIMVAVFAVFGTLSMQVFMQLGLGPGATLLPYATLIRVVL